MIGAQPRERGESCESDPVGQVSLNVFGNAQPLPARKTAVHDDRRRRAIDFERAVDGQDTKRRIAGYLVRLWLEVFALPAGIEKKNPVTVGAATWHGESFDCSVMSSVLEVSSAARARPSRKWGTRSVADSYSSRLREIMTRVGGAATQACVSRFSQISHVASALRRCGNLLGLRGVQRKQQFRASRFATPSPFCGGRPLWLGRLLTLNSTDGDTR